MSNGVVFASVDSQSCRTNDKALETLRGEILGWGLQPAGSRMAWRADPALSGNFVCLVKRYRISQTSAI